MSPIVNIGPDHWARYQLAFNYPKQSLRAHAIPRKIPYQVSDNPWFDQIYFHIQRLNY